MKDVRHSCHSNVLPLSCSSVPRTLRDINYYVALVVIVIFLAVRKL